MNQNQININKLTITMLSDEKAKAIATWGSWEELLLACAVKRHGFKNWDSVAMELQTKTSLPRPLTTAQCCRQKFHDLKRRFSDHDKLDDNINKINIPWLDQLRKVRVDELKQDLQRYDLSILSLQLKVKRLEEDEWDRCLDDDKISGQQKPDLDGDEKLDEAVKVEEPVRLSKGLVSGEESDRENRSVNGSNSTGLSDKIGGGGDGGELGVNAETVQVPVLDGSGGEGPVESGSKEEEELGNSVTQLSSDLQSSTSFGSKRRKTTSSNNFNSNFNSIIIKRSGSTSTASDAKSQPLIRLLQMISTHRHASLFQRPRLNDDTQEWNKYKEVIRQHVDIETIQTRVEGGSYGVLTFYRDLLLLLNNAVVYFPKASLESETALQLRNLVTTEIRRDTTHNSADYSSSQEQDLVLPSLLLPPPPQPQPLLERSDSLLANHKSSAPIVVCRKRSSVSSKPASSFAQKGDFKQQQNDDDGDKKPDATDPMNTRGAERSLLKSSKEEKAIITTGTRSSRSSSRNLTGTAITTPSSSNKKKQNTAKGSKGGAAASGSVDNKQETTPKPDNKKKEEEEKTQWRSEKKKTVVDFLKRIKKNSPVQTLKKSSSSTSSEEQKKNNNNNNNNNNSGKKKDKDKGKERIILLRRGAAKQESNTNPSPSKRSVGRPSKTKNTAVSGKLRRKSGGKEEEVETVVAKRPSKRARR